MNNERSFSTYKVILFFLTLFSLAFTGCSLFSSNSSQPAQSGQPQGKGGAAGGRGNQVASVAVSPVSKQDVPVYLAGLGTVTAFNTENVKSRIDGQLIEVRFKEGDYVKKGDMLAVIDPRPYEAQLSQMQAQLYKDQATNRDLKLNLERDNSMVKDGILAPQQRDTQQSLVDQSEGAIRSDQAQIDNVKLQLVYCHITASIAGRIGLRQIDAGNMVHAGDANPLVVITQQQPIAVLFNLPEDVLPKVAANMRNNTLHVDAYDRGDQVKLTSGNLLTIDNTIDPTTGTAKLKAVFDNKDNELWPNQFVNVHLLIETRKDSIVVPTVAIQRGPQTTFVYVLKSDNTAELRNVNVALTQGNITVIGDGLSAGETVIVDGQDKLQNGSKVEVRAPAGNGAGGGKGGGKRGGKGGGAPAPDAGAGTPAPTPADGNPAPGDHKGRGQGKNGDASTPDSTPQGSTSPAGKDGQHKKRSGKGPTTNPGN